MRISPFIIPLVIITMLTLPTLRSAAQEKPADSIHHTRSKKFYHIDSLVYDFSKGDFVNTKNEKNFTHDFYINKHDRLKVIVRNINQLMYQTDLKLNARNITYDATNQDLSTFANLVKAVSKSPDSTTTQKTLDNLKTNTQASSNQIQASVANIGSVVDDLFKSNKVTYSPDGKISYGNDRSKKADSLNLKGEIDISNAAWTYYQKDSGWLHKNYPGYIVPQKGPVDRATLLGTIKINMIEMKQNVQKEFSYINDTIFNFMTGVNVARNNYYSLITQISKAAQSNLAYSDAVREILTTIENLVPTYNTFTPASLDNEASLDQEVRNFNEGITQQIELLQDRYMHSRGRIEVSNEILKSHTDLMTRLYSSFSFADTISAINTFADSTLKSTLFQLDTVYNNTVEYINKVRSNILDFIRFVKSKQNFEIVATKDDIDADKVIILFQAIPQEQFTSSLLSKYVKALSYDTLAIVKVKSGVVLNLSTGFFWNFGLADRNYRLDTFFNAAGAKTDSVQIHYAKSTNQYLPSFGALLHVYKRTLNDVSWGGAFGLSINTDGSYSAYLGLSLIIGKTERFILSGGLAGARVKYLSSNYSVGDLIPVSRQLQSSDLPTDQAYRFGGFASISFNLGSILK